MPSSAWQIPRPLQRLFDTFPLVTYDRPADLPARAHDAVSPDLPTLYIFTTPDDALLGKPSFNPGCLKWQTYLRIHSIPFRTLPSTNHASPSGSLPFLLPPPSTTPAPATPIPASQFPAYVARHKQTSPPSSKTITPPTPQPPTKQANPTARDALITSLLPPLRAAFLTHLYLLPHSLPLLDALYLRPSTSSPLLQASLRSSLRKAAEREVLNALACSSGGFSSSGAGGGGGGGCAPVVDISRVMDEAWAAMEALAGFLSEAAEGEGDGPWFSGGTEPGELDCAVFGFTFLMEGYFSDHEINEGGDTLGHMVRHAGGGEMWTHLGRMAERAGWGGMVDEFGICGGEERKA